MNTKSEDAENEIKGSISELLSKLKKGDEEKEKINLVDIAKKLSSRKFKEDKNV
jgi:hypothetical protein